MPSPAKPTTSLTREELEMQSSNSLESEGIKRRGFMGGTTRKDDELRMEIIRKTSTRMSLSDVDIVMQIVKQYGTQERIDEGKILNMRVSTARTDEPELKDYTDGYNLCRRSLTQEIRNRNTELTALKDKQEVAN